MISIGFFSYTSAYCFTIFDSRFGVIKSYNGTYNKDYSLIEIYRKIKELNEIYKPDIICSGLSDESWNSASGKVPITCIKATGVINLFAQSKGIKYNEETVVNMLKKTFKRTLSIKERMELFGATSKYEADSMLTATYFCNFK